MVQLHWVKTQILDNQGQVVRKPVSANAGLKVNRSIHFYVLCGLSLVMLKAEEQIVETENLIKKLQ